MASMFRTSLPDRLSAVLEYRSSVTEGECPADVTVAMAKLPFFCSGSIPVVPSSRFTSGGGRTETARGGASGGNRFASLSGSNTSWRPTQSQAHTSEDDGFQTYTRRRGTAPSGGGGGGAGGGGGRFHTTGGKVGGWGGGGGHGRFSRSRPSPPTSSPPTDTPACGGAGAGAAVEESAEPLPTAVAFSSAAIKANIATEERILAKVKGKINKIGHSTYDATKVFMQQILDSEETDFLDDFMKFVFQKAATESAFCPLYARLLHELADEFTHLRDTMCTLFRDYTAIFSEADASHTPDASSESYKEFLERQERKKFRRGYSQFVAELVKLGEVDLESFRILLFQIVGTIEEFHTDSGKTALSEEYVDCLSNMCRSASPILILHSWSADIHTRLRALISKPPASLPGFTTKTRFAVMNLVDYASRGWK